MSDRWALRGCLVTLAALSAACNAILGVNDVTPESANLDANASIDAQQCDVLHEFTLVAANPQTSLLGHHTTDSGTSLLFLLNSDPRPDIVALDLYDNMGGHVVVNATGTFPLSSSDAELSTCGVCVEIFADVDKTTTTPSQTYLASRGTLKLTKFDTTGVAGSLTNLELRQVDSSAAQDIPNGCIVTIDDAEFSAEWPTPGQQMLSVHRAVHPAY
jgi:hypothetical protein